MSLLHRCPKQARRHVQRQCQAARLISGEFVGNLRGNRAKRGLATLQSRPSCMQKKAAVMTHVLRTSAVTAVDSRLMTPQGRIQLLHSTCRAKRAALLFGLL